ncbi:MAG: UPF0158 family protein [Bryobacteraceae bacterium]|jgi:Uncharacterised protein family (UPF0158)
MSAAARLTGIIDVLEMQSDDNALSFFDRKTGGVTTVSKDLLGYAEDFAIEEMPDIHEWQILSDFSNAVESPKIRAELLDAIHGGAFRHFKAAVRLHGMEDEGYRFRVAALRQIAIDWCEEHDIAWV